LTCPVATLESIGTDVAPLTARVRTRAGLVTVKRIGTNPLPPTNEALSTWSWRTTSTCDSASRNELVILGEILAGSSCRSGSMRIACLKASTPFSSESDAL